MNLRLSKGALSSRHALNALLAEKEWLRGYFREKGMKGHEGQRYTGQGAQPMPSKGMKGIDTQSCPCSCPPMPLLMPSNALVKIEGASTYKPLVSTER